jgi:hypothetical protein
MVVILLQFSQWDQDVLGDLNMITSTHDLVSVAITFA